MKNICTDYARYNLWANSRLAEMLAPLTEAQFEENIESSFPSVKKTVLHVWGAEWVWLQRLQGTSPTHFPMLSFGGSKEEALEQWLKSSAEFLDFTEALADGFFEKTLHFNTLAGGLQSARASDMIHHCMNHSTYHRGQLVTLARQLGVEKPPSTDFMLYLWER